MFYYAFDLLHLNGEDLRHRTVVERRELLERLLLDPPAHIRLSCTLEGTESYWRWPQRNLNGNAIDFFIHVLGLSFHDAMRQIIALDQFAYNSSPAGATQNIKSRLTTPARPVGSKAK